MNDDTPTTPWRAGSSLAHDAWRRLRRDRVAMTALVAFVLVVVAALVTPLLPLQPPDRHAPELQFQRPTASPFWKFDFELDRELLAAGPGEAEQLRAELPALRKAYDAKQRELAEARRRLADDLTTAARAAALEPLEAAVDEAFYALSRQQSAADDAIQAAYVRAGFAELGPVGRWMVRARHRLFGERELNSLCGRDALGRDVLSRICWGARISLVVGFVATLVSLVIGVTYGAVAGYLGGRVDNAMMRLVDVMYSIPFIFVVIFILTMLNHDQTAHVLAYYGVTRITVFYAVIGAIYWLTMARVVRGQVISLKTEPFVEAARALGAGRRRIIFLHLLPNVASVVLVYLTLTIPRVILFESFLSFLGLGVEAPDVSWGLLAREGFKALTPVEVYWWLVLFPSLGIGVTLLALNFLGDGLRDALDPRLRDR